MIRFILILVAVFCGPSIAADSNAPVSKGFTTHFTDDPYLKNWLVDDGWHIEGDCAIGCVNTDWRRTQVAYEAQSAQLKLKKDATAKTGFSSGSIASRDRFHYGYFEAALKAAKADGVVTGFFTYIGQPGRENEIDVEILGRDTRKVQFTYHVNGRDSGGVTVDLPFDSAEDYHVFGFDWQPTYIRWYADGKLLLTDDGHKLPLPTEATQIMFDLWNGAGSNMDSWLKPFQWKDKPIVASMRCFSYRPDYDGTSNCQPPK